MNHGLDQSGKIHVLRGKLQPPRLDRRGDQEIVHDLGEAIDLPISAIHDYLGQSGALNEHMADVFGAMVRHSMNPDYPYPFLLGDNALTDAAKSVKNGRGHNPKALRDMLNPHRGYSSKAEYVQPKHMSEVLPELGPDCDPTKAPDNCGVHILSGIPNRVAANVIRRIGWEASEKLFYRVMTARLRSNSDFNDYRNQVMDEALETLSPEQVAKIKAAFELVGLN